MKQKMVWILLLAGLLPAWVMAETGVRRSIITTGVINKEPVSNLQQVSNELSRVYYFTELRGLKGHTITHRWEYNGKLMAEVSFEIGAQRWRTWSTKNMQSNWMGAWQVSVLDEGGNIMEQQQFEFTQIEEPVKVSSVLKH